MVTFDQRASKMTPIRTTLGDLKIIKIKYKPLKVIIETLTQWWVCIRVHVQESQGPRLSLSPWG